MGNFVQKNLLASSAALKPEYLAAGDPAERDYGQKEDQSMPKVVKLEGVQHSDHQNQIRDRELGVSLVDWYSEDDPEV